MYLFDNSIICSKKARNWPRAGENFSQGIIVQKFETTECKRIVTGKYRKRNLNINNVYFTKKTKIRLKCFLPSILTSGLGRRPKKGLSFNE